MREKKCIKLWIFLVLLIVAIVLGGIVAIGRGGNYMSPERALRRFSRIIERGNLDGLTLTIYYRCPRSTANSRISGRELVERGWYDNKTVITSNELGEHIELLKQMNTDVLMPVSHELFIMTVLYYVFEYNGREVLGIVPQADPPSVFINGIEFEWNDVFFDIMRPFLSEDMVKLWDESFGF